LMFTIGNDGGESRRGGMKNVIYDGVRATGVW